LIRKSEGVRQVIPNKALFRKVWNHFVGRILDRLRARGHIQQELITINQMLPTAQARFGFIPKAFDSRMILPKSFRVFDPSIGYQILGRLVI